MGLGDPADPLGPHGHHPGLDGDMYSQQAAPPRTKRMRTSFKHHQLRTMKSYFAMNHNPDAKDLKQLAHKTGLTKRVLQVWFQNARAKYRRTVTKKDDDKSDKNTSNGSEDQSASSPPADEHDNSSNSSSGGGAGGGGGGAGHGGLIQPDTPSSHDPAADTSYDDEHMLVDDMATYSELKTASPALADEVSTIASMPMSARSDLTTATTVHAASDLLRAGLQYRGVGGTTSHMSSGGLIMSSGFVEIFNK
ncbi:uncharacterized protein [Diadema antillarum]|uniref:uncharacterized protein n=1 Tax=Diadema antillarum TaxID=105358 RepID=UPI003A8497D1